VSSRPLAWRVSIATGVLVASGHEFTQRWNCQKFYETRVPPARQSYTLCETKLHSACLLSQQEPILGKSTACITTCASTIYLTTRTFTAPLLQIWLDCCFSLLLMKIRAEYVALVACTTLILLATGARADLPVLAAGRPVQDGSDDLFIDWSQAAPTVVDWNNDGKLDLVVGQRKYSMIRVFLNQGTVTEPVFNGSFLVQNAGTNLTFDYG
jgi:hypothetical protein